MKILAMYLPQYHEIKENNEWWGKGYTEWSAVKSARPLFRGHKQPRIPLDNRYYDLVEEGLQTWQWQAGLAQKYGVYGFCIYHYWFQPGKQLLERPMEILRDNPQININYCICWANESWRRNWYGQQHEMLMEQKYGGEKEWTIHFNYLNTFFQDKRYIKINNKPVINIYRSADIEQLPQMLEVWNKLAMESGFDGLYIVSARTAGVLDDRDNLFDAYYMFEPGYTLKKGLKSYQEFGYLAGTMIKRLWNKCFKKSILEHKIDTKMIYRNIERLNLPDKCFPGTFPQWDNTPRTGNIGLYYKNSSPELFEEHIKKLWSCYSDTREFLYLNAWNEWGEGAYLEPDEDNKYRYLEVIKRTVEGE